MKHKEKQVSVTQYAASRGITRQAVLKRLHPIPKPLVGLIRAEKVGSTWLLTVAD